MHRVCAELRALREFDDRITAYYCGFTGADDYYARAAAANVVDRIARPALVIHAANDPFVRILPETRQKSVRQSQHYLHRNQGWRALRIRGRSRWIFDL